MKQSRLLNLAAAALLAGLVSICLPAIVHANTPQAVGMIGRFWSNPEFDMAEGWDGSYAQYPGGIPRNDFAETDPRAVRRDWVGHHRKGGVHYQVVDWTNPGGDLGDPGLEEYSSAGSFRSNMGGSVFRGGSVGPQAVRETYRWDRPEVWVNGVQFTDFFNPLHPDSLQVVGDNDGTRPRPAPEVDATQVTELKIETWQRAKQGIELHRSIYYNPWGQAHQDYVLQNYLLTHNAKSDTSDVVIDGQTAVNGFIWACYLDYQQMTPTAYESGHGGLDMDAMYIEPWGVGNHSVSISWDGDYVHDNSPGPDYGDPAQAEKMLGHLVGNAFIFYGGLFASAGPGAQMDVDDPAQPAWRLYTVERGLGIAGAGYPVDAAEMRTRTADGFEIMPIGQSYRTYEITQSILDFNDRGATAMIGYGPVTEPVDGDHLKQQGWNMGLDESVRIVQVLGIGGIDQEEGRRIGNAWNANRDANPGSPETWMSQADIDLYMTGRDTAMKAMALAWWNYYGSFADNVNGDSLTKWGIADYVTSKPAEYNEPYNIPDGPRPPGWISAWASDQGNMVRWGKEAEGSLDHDTDVADLVGYRVYRQVASRAAPWELVAEGPYWYYGEQVADANGGAGRYFVDQDVQTGTSYWYAVTTYDDGSQNWAQPGVPIECSRYWCWTGWVHTGVTATVTPAAVSSARPGSFSLAQNAPNPFNPTTTISFTLPASESVTLAIYDLNGRLVNTLVSGVREAGAHEVSWNGTDSVGRDVASGVYVYRLTGENTSITKRMTLIR